MAAAFIVTDKHFFIYNKAEVCLFIYGRVKVIC